MLEHHLYYLFNNICGPMGSHEFCNILAGCARGYRNGCISDEIDFDLDAQGGVVPHLQNCFVWVLGVYIVVVQSVVNLLVVAPNVSWEQLAYWCLQIYVEVN